ncbi:protein FAM192A [Anoplophora glabripennis]|uniref:protein FAM192A n=1 Tax=Anoplophora glabripennis TaxID=217634 RepID=UPI000874D974|nr:protein FAM192A [Anoplophora glabripennis]
MSSGFITESEAAEIRKRRQEEWEKVRKTDDPLERPEEPYDPRSLYERLQEQKQKKDLEYEEAHKLKNMIKGLDDDEIEFLDMVDRTKLEADRKKEMEEERELNDYRNRVAILHEKSIEERLQAEIVVNKPKTQTTSRSSQQKLLKGVVIKKNDGLLKRKLSDGENNIKPNEPEAKQIKQDIEETDDNKISNGNADVMPKSGLKCVAILPGLGFYEDSSSDENSSDSEIEINICKKVDILGRKIEKKENDA